jgi:hypothetical protein
MIVVLLWGITVLLAIAAYEIVDIAARLRQIVKLLTASRKVSR